LSFRSFTKKLTLLS